MKFILYAVIFLAFFSKCKLAKDPSPQPSPSIEESKKDSVFLYEYRPQSPVLTIEGKDYKIKEAWIEYPHVEGNWGHTPIKGTFDFVMTFEYHGYDGTNFNNYTKDLSLGSNVIWFFLRENENPKDTVVLNYRVTLSSNERKTFLLFRNK